jgi:hypothetical protein
MTSEAIRTAARDFNADYPESAAEIDAGEAIIRVSCDSWTSTGSVVRAVVHTGIRTADGSFIGSGDGAAYFFGRKDGRESTAWNARRVMRPRWSNVEVPIEYTCDWPRGTVIRDEAGNTTSKPRARKAAGRGAA